MLQAKHGFVTVSEKRYDEIGRRVAIAPAVDLD